MVAELNDLAARISELESTSPTPAPDPLRAELDELACRIADLEARDTNERGLRERAEKAEKTIADVVKYANMELSIPSTTDRHEGIDIAIKGVLRIINSNK